MAYAVGLLTADGNLSNDKRHMVFTSMDKDQVGTLKKCLGIKNRIGRISRKAGHDKKYFRVQFGDVLFYRWLFDLGLTPNKSKTIGLSIPAQYFFDFLRGCFDGDGCINAYWDPRWPRSYMFYVRFASASEKYLEWLDATIRRLSNAIGRVRRDGPQDELVFAKKASRLLFKKMFYSERVPCLKRKFLKAIKIFETDRCKHDFARVEKLVNSYV